MCRAKAAETNYRATTEAKEQAQHQLKAVEVQAQQQLKAAEVQAQQQLKAAEVQAQKQYAALQKAVEAEAELQRKRYIYIL